MQEIESYEKWIAWRVKSGAEPITRTQSLFAKEVLGNDKLVEMLSSIGDLDSIFKSIQKHLKA